MIRKTHFGQTPDGQSVDHYLLENAHGCRAGLITFGAAIQSLEVPDKNGNFIDVVLGYPDLAGYLGSTNPRHGATIGRVANRVRNGRFSLNGQIVELSKNKDPHHMHGGFVSFDKRVWHADILNDGNGPDEDPAVRFTLFSWDGEEGYPGNLNVSLTYTLTADHALRLVKPNRRDARHIRQGDVQRGQLRRVVRLQHRHDVLQHLGFHLHDVLEPVDKAHLKIETRIFI